MARPTTKGEPVKIRTIIFHENIILATSLSKGLCEV